MTFPAKKYSYKKWHWRIAAALLDCITLPLGFWKKLKKIEDLDLNDDCKILIFSTGGIGDAVVLEPLIRALKLRYSQSQIDVIAPTTAGKIFKLMPQLNAVVEFPSGGAYFSCWRAFMRKKNTVTKYDVAIDAKGDPLAIAYMILHGVRHRVGYSNGGGANFLEVRANAFRLRPRYLQHLDLLTTTIEKTTPHLSLSVQPNPQPTVVIHLGAGEDSKRWPLDHWQELIKAITSSYSIVMVGTEADARFAETFPLEIQACYSKATGKPLIETLEIIASAQLFIGHDTGLSHAAAALAVPTLCLFSLSHNPNIWAPQPAQIFPFTPPEAQDCSAQSVIEYLRSL